MFKEIKNFNAILCLSTDLFNYSYQALEGEYWNYCKIFDIDIISAFKPINWFGKNGELPQDLQAFLYNI
jgi:hypothetical protein